MPVIVDIGDEEDVLVWRAGEVDVRQLAHRAVRAVAAADIGGGDGAAAAVRRLERRGDVIGMLREIDHLGVPLDRDAELIELFTHDKLVVVLAEH